MDLARKIDAAGQILRSARGNAIALTGAGISTASGLPDYRGPSGLWRNRRFEELASIQALYNEPAIFWEFYQERLDVLRHAAPNPAHKALGALLIRGVIDMIITQNVDGLQQQVLPPNLHDRVLEVHGSLRTSVCLTCTAVIGMDAVLDRARTAVDGVPRCDCRGVLKPDVVLFGEMLPECVETAFERASSASVLMACGTSLQVYPVAYLPEVVAGNGGDVVIINQGPTGMDHLARVTIDADLGPVVTAMVDAERIPD
jgi:NAD-dependent deacetylase